MKEVHSLRFEKDFVRWCTRLGPDHVEKIEAEINRMIDEKPNRIHTSSWMPGNDWTGTPFQAIYEIACEFDQYQSALCFGLMVQHVFLTRPEMWYFGKFEKDGDEIRGLTYFQKGE